jgi:predicted RNA-binding Zn-ribbon protein involved in translation (DUF1610 family)
MSLEEFKQSSVRYTKRSLIACLTPLGILLILILVYAPFSRNVEAWLTSRFGATQGDLLATVPFALVTILAFGALIILARRVDRQFGIACVHCQKPLLHYRHIVTASRNCPHCGKRVIEESPTAS